MFKQEKGVTLVALVITIIVLLILAGVSIALVAGDNGVLTRAQKSGEKTKWAQIKEATGLALVDCQSFYVDAYGDGKVSDSSMYKYYTENEVARALEGQGYTLLKGTETDGKYTWTAVSYDKTKNPLGSETAADSTTDVAVKESEVPLYAVCPEGEEASWVTVKFIKGTMGYTAQFGTTIGKVDAGFFDTTTP